MKNTTNIKLIKMSNLRMLISIFNDNYGPDFLKNLIIDKCVVSGSLLPNFAIGKRNFNDIDIYCPKECKNLEEYIETKLGGIKQTSPDYFDNFGNPIICVKYITHYKPINIIYTPCSNKEEIKLYITRISDLTICTSWFDGNEYWLHPDALNGVAHPINIKSLSIFLEGDEFTTSAKFNTPNEMYDYYVTKRIIRARKYEKIGFVVDMNTVPTEQILSLEEKIKTFNEETSNKVKERVFFMFFLYKLNLDRNHYNIIYTGDSEKFEDIVEDVQNSYSGYELKKISKKTVNFRNFPPLKLWSSLFEEWSSKNEHLLGNWKETIDRNL